MGHQMMLKTFKTDIKTMKISKLIFLASFLIFLVSASGNAQNEDLIKRDKVVEAFNQKEHALAVNIIKDIKPQFKSWPLNMLGIEIISKHELLKKEPYNDYRRIEELRDLVDQYLASPKTNNDQNLEEVIEIKYRLQSFPENEQEFLNKVEEMKRKAEVAQIEIEKRKEEQRLREEQEAVEREVSLQAARVQAEKDRIAAEKARIEREKLERERNAREAIAESENRARREKETKKANRKYRLKTQTFSSLGLITGEIGKYGLLYETGGGSKTIGFRIALRSSLVPEEDILNGSVIENRNEVDLGPNVKLAKFLFLNVGGGYGFSQFKTTDFYRDTDKVDYEEYFTASAGLTIRLGRVVNLSGGASFKDIDQDISEPEYTLGLTFNLKGKNRY
jgi:hypothetical protein